MKLGIATRRSPLARWQAEHVVSLLGLSDPDIEAALVEVETTGDRRGDVPIHVLGGKGAFVKEVQAALLDGRADLAVHSAKDLPSSTPAGLVLAAVPERGDPRDALVGCALGDLAPGAIVATGSVRRRAQLAARRPDLDFAELRGNIATRLAMAADFDAIVVAAAALQRLGEEPAVLDVLDVATMVPQVGQGAIAVEVRADGPLAETVRAIEHAPSRVVVDAERAFLAELGGDCDVPAGAHASLVDGSAQLHGLIAAPDGSVVIDATMIDRDPEALGRAVARHLLDERGGAALLEAAASA